LRGIPRVEWRRSIGLSFDAQKGVCCVLLQKVPGKFRWPGRVEVWLEPRAPIREMKRGDGFHLKQRGPYFVESGANVAMVVLRKVGGVNPSISSGPNKRQGSSPLVKWDS
ncbi:unnamed protein product, partial [Ectocarpus sp. 12 AP-2014]